MKDLDFDELDQAVSSVLGANAEPKKEDASPSVAEPAPVKPEPTESKAADKPLEKIEDKKPDEEKPASVTPTVSPAVRRRGQFLDMVHPSADMTSRLPITSPAARKQLSPVSSDANSLKSTPAPTPAEVNKVEDDVTSAEAPAAEKLDVSVQDKPAEEPQKSDSDIKWPDPLDLNSPMQPEIPATTSELAEEKTPVEPAVTPFVPDVKVDKRPLGGTTVQPTEASQENAMVASEAEVQTAVISPETSIEDAKMPVATPPELQPEVVSVEAAADREFAPDGTDTETSEETNKGRAQSIPQQYRTPAEKPDTATHPVFDTKEYHQPLLPAHGKKKAKGWLVVVIIVALLVVGAVLGYLAYMANL